MWRVAAAHTQVLLDDATFAAIHNRLQPLGAKVVDVRGWDSAAWPRPAIVPKQADEPRVRLQPKLRLTPAPWRPSSSCQVMGGSGGVVAAHGDARTRLRAALRLRMGSRSSLDGGKGGVGARRNSASTPAIMVSVHVYACACSARLHGCGPAQGRAFPAQPRPGQARSAATTSLLVYACMPNTDL